MGAGLRCSRDALRVSEALTQGRSLDGRTQEDGKSST